MRIEQSKKDMILTRILSQEEEDKFIEDAKSEIICINKNIEEKTKALEKVKESRTSAIEKRKQLDEWMQTLKEDIKSKNIDFKKIAEDVSNEVKKDDFEREKEELEKKKAILVKTIEGNKRNKEKAYLKKIDYKSNELKEQKNEIKDLKQRNEKMKQLNQSIEQIIETSRLNETVIKESSLSKSRISIDTPRNVNTSFDNIPINKSIALPSLNNARLKSELKNSYASPLNARKSHKMAFNTKIPMSVSDQVPAKPTLKMPDINRPKIPDDDLKVIDTDLLNVEGKKEQNNILQQIK